jgi:hypothetical protein
MCPENERLAVAQREPALFADDSMGLVDRLVDAGEARVALEVYVAVRVRKGDALVAFVRRATPEELREYIGKDGV